MHITGIQFDIKWENKVSNLNMLDQLISEIPKETEVLILPEMFTTGFSMNPKPFSESMKGPTISWMKKKSEQIGAAICGSIMIFDEGIYRNRFIWVDPFLDEISYYDKSHPFCLNKEASFFPAGKERKIIEYKGWRIFPTICYDLRFPVWNRNDKNYDLLINVANWPKVRAFSWKQFLSARALENQSYVIGINRVGKDAFNMPFSGDSSVISYDGKALNQAKENETQILSAELSKDKLLKYRQDYPFLENLDTFTIH